MVCITGVVAGVLGRGGEGKFMEEVMWREGRRASTSEGGHNRAGCCPPTPTAVELLLLLNGPSNQVDHGRFLLYGPTDGRIFAVQFFTVHPHCNQDSVWQWHDIEVSTFGVLVVTKI